LAKKTRKEINKLSNKKKTKSLDFFNGEYNGWWYYQLFSNILNSSNNKPNRR